MCHKMQVVQDFVQMTDEGENNPSNWLHRLLASSSKDSEEHTVSLKGMLAILVPRAFSDFMRMRPWERELYFCQSNFIRHAFVTLLPWK
jgi:hypothetical protein